MIAPEELQHFADSIERRFGHGQDNGRYNDLSNILEARIRATGNKSYAAYRTVLAHSETEWTALAPLLTVPETYFFRLPDQYEALAQAVVPTLLRTRAKERRLRLLSAGCASGEEPYSLRMLLNERFPQLAPERGEWQVEIDAFDLSQPALERARLGDYSAWSLRATSPERRLANFAPAGPGGKLFRLLPHARAGVSFFCRNLLDPPANDACPYDVIFCRNVLIYLSAAAIDRAIAHLTAQLAPGGYLFLGPAESLRGLTRNFVLCQTHEVFYYRRRDRITLPAEAQRSCSASPETAAPLAAQRRPAPQPDLHWFEAIQDSSARLAKLVDASPGQMQYASAAKRSVAVAGKRRTRTHPEPEQEPEPALTRAIAFFRSDSFAEALSSLENVPAMEQADPATRLVRASALAQLGRYEDAERECTLVLAADDRNAGAHFLFGLCREQAGALPEAEEHMRQASYLDPSFAMSQLHLGLLARRRQDPAAARRAFGRALSAFRLEDPARVALFAGSLDRESLGNLCQRELVRLDAEA